MTQQELDEYVAEYLTRPDDDTRKPWTDAGPENSDNQQQQEGQEQ